MRTITREELHALVWASPMTKVSVQFGLSDVALHKICRRHDVPTPPPGYWARKQHGKPVTVTPLPPAGSGPLLIRERTVMREGSAAWAARERVREALMGGDSEGATGRADPVLDRSLAALAGGRTGTDGFIRTAGDDLVAIAVRPGSVPRAQALLTGLVRSARLAGITLIAAPDGARWLAEGEQVAFTFGELADRVEHEPTERELRALEKWEAERAACLKRTGFDSSWGRPRVPRWEARFQGRLGFTLEAVRDRTTHEYGGPVLRTAFNDTRTRDIGKALPQVVAAIAAIAATKRGNATADAERRRARAEAEQRRRAAELTAARERQREAGLAALLARHAEGRALAAWLSDLAARGGTAPLPARVGRLETWAAARLARWNEAAAPDRLEGWLAERELFAPDEDGPPGLP